VSVIRELPPGRTPIETRAIPQSRRDEAYALVRRELEAGRQAYVVYPLVEESSKIDVRAATEMADHLAAEVFPEYRLALVHGRLRPEAKDRAMRAFAAGEVQVLVATTVIEVGIDVASASVIVVEDADRFGLAQLHQLRGRVGRGDQKSYCVLIGSAGAGAAELERLRILEETDDGFRVAERDLELRGPGELAGAAQSGAPSFRVADLVRHQDLLLTARRAAFDVVEKSGAAGVAPAMLAETMRRHGERLRLAEIG